MIDPQIVRMRKWLFRVFSGSWSQVRATAVKVNRVDEVFLITESASGVLHPLDFGVEGFAGCVGDPMLDEGQYVFDSTLQHSSDFDHRFEPTSGSPPIPSLKEGTCGAGVGVAEYRHRRFLQCPCPGRLQRTLPERCKLPPSVSREVGGMAQPLVFGPHQTPVVAPSRPLRDRKSTRLNSSHRQISYGGFCLVKKKDE